MNDFKRKDEEHVSRQQAAERLTDVAYALSAGQPLELTVNGDRVSVPIADDMRLTRDVKSKGDHVQLELELRWSTADTAAPAPSGAAAAGLER
jgi:amphi-Trp domain-containing protein